MGCPKVGLPISWATFAHSVVANGPRYWHQGYSIFSKYDDGIWMTDDAWYGVTHESVAKYEHIL